MKNPIRNFTLAALVGISALTACTSLGTEEDQAEAGSLWQLMAGYQDWSYFDGHEGLMKGASPHGKYVRSFINAPGAANQSTPAYGTIIVKENYSKNDLSSLAGLTVMQRIEGYDEENDDWFWARYTPRGKLTHSGKVAFCSDCHFDADGDDFVFLNDK